MADEQNNPQKTQEEKEREQFEEFKKEYENLANEVESLRFFSDQVRFNSIMYQGFDILLKKVTEIDEKLSGLINNIQNKNANQS